MRSIAIGIELTSEDLDLLVRSLYFYHEKTRMMPEAFSHLRELTSRLMAAEVAATEAGYDRYARGGN